MKTTKQYSRKRRKPSSSGKQNTPIDRLSSLPDAILCHILSFLPTEMSVATSILARRWRFLWADVPNLEFNSETHHVYTDFPDVVSKVMLLYKVERMNTFRLVYTDHCSDYELDTESLNDYKLDTESLNDQLETWITIAISRNVQNIDLHLWYEVELPPCLFTCKTLVYLRLHSCIGIPMRSAICLPSLKNLHLYSMKYGDDEALPDLLSGCPVLEELLIDKIMDDDLVCCRISSPTIKKLTVNFQFDGTGEYSHDYSLEINAPALVYLRLEDCLSENISAQGLSSLIEAYICFNNENKVYEQPGYAINVWKFLDSLCHVKCLKLSCDYEFFMIDAFEDLREPVIRFDNLTKLELAAHWIFLTKFLETADNLEVLIIHDVKSENLKDWWEPFKLDPVDWEPFTQVPPCLLSHLTTIVIFGCCPEYDDAMVGYPPCKVRKIRWIDSEFQLVKYLLRNGKALQEMKIYTQRPGIDVKEKLEALMCISNYQRGSEECKLVFR